MDVSKIEQSPLKDMEGNLKYSSSPVNDDEPIHRAD